MIKIGIVSHQFEIHKNHTRNPINDNLDNKKKINNRNVQNTVEPETFW